MVYLREAQGSRNDSINRISADKKDSVIGRDELGKKQGNDIDVRIARKVEDDWGQS